MTESAFTLRPARREDYITLMTAATPGGDCPLFKTTLDYATDGDVELQAYLQRWFGYCLTGDTREQVMTFFFGPGGTGKTTILEAVRHAWGDYARSAPVDLLTEAMGERHPTELAGLRGARLVLLSETEEGRRWAESRIKMLTGGDMVSARFMRGDFFEYKPSFKLIVYGNHRPRLRNPDGAMRRRFHIVPFKRIVPEAERDFTLPEKLKAEAGGILAWAIEGCREWQAQGLKPPPSVIGETDQYFAAEDALARWLEEECLTGNAYGPSYTGYLWKRWQAWCERTGEHAGTERRFSESLDAKGFERHRDKNGRGFGGIGIRAESGREM